MVEEGRREPQGEPQSTVGKVGKTQLLFRSQLCQVFPLENVQLGEPFGPPKSRLTKRDLMKTSRKWRPKKCWFKDMIPEIILKL